MSRPSQPEERTGDHVSSRPRGLPNEAPLSRQTSASQRDLLPRSGGQALPSLATITSDFENAREQGNSVSPTMWRPLGVRNILNPASDLQSSQAPPMPPSPRTIATSAQHSSQAVPGGSPHVRKRGEPHSPQVDPQAHPGVRTGRRILTPRSPALRAASMGAHRSPSLGAGMISRVPLLSGEGRGYTAEPGDSRDAVVPPLPPVSTTVRSGLVGLSARDLVSPTMRSASSNNGGPPAGPMTQQQENRPEPNRPPYVGADASPSGFPLSQSQMLQPSAPTGNDSQINYGPPAPGPIRSGLPYGQTEYQLTFETQQGPMVVPVNVDYQQASKLADEKRRRNAGASARFRARRKEKEREANQTITGLQQELQDLAEEREFYLRERNFFRDLLVRSNLGPLPARPHSPQARRTHSGTSVPADASQTGRSDVDMSTSQRRRAGEYAPSLTSQSPGTPYNPSFPPPGPPMALPTPASTNTYSDPRGGPAGAPPASTRPPPYDPLRRNVLDRDWTTGR